MPSAYPSIPRVDGTLTERSVPIHAVGWGKSHDPSTLWVLSNHTKGTYTSVPEFYDLVRRTISRVTGS